MMNNINFLKQYRSGSINCTGTLKSAITSFKRHRMEDFDERINQKTESIISYLKKHRIKNIVVGVSGGVDSSAVIGLLSVVKDVMIADGYPLEVHGVNISFYQYQKVYDRTYFDDLINNYPDIKFSAFNMDVTEHHLFGDLRLEGLPPENKANVNYAMRYLAFFAVAQSLPDCITIGTTNRDEMGYIGWFGKTSDMVVDLQIISDLHKFEVKELASSCGVPDSIINRAPTGDLIDGKDDEFHFGCSYDELSFWTYLHRYGKTNIIDSYIQSSVYSKVRALREKNSHKYQGQTFNPIFID